MVEKEDFSYGVVPVYKENNTWFVLVAHQISYRGDSFWIFPKGHAEEGETGERAALRELEEETGVVSVELESQKTFSMSYTFRHEGELINKTVTYYIGRVSSKETKITQPREIKELRWVNFDEAKKMLTHQNSIEILNQVSAYLGDN